MWLCTAFVHGAATLLGSESHTSGHLGGCGCNKFSLLPPQTNGTSNGLVPMLRVFNNTARYVDQGGNKRPGAFAVYLEPWHADVFDFLDLRKNTGKEEQVCACVC